MAYWKINSNRKITTSVKQFGAGLNLDIDESVLNDYELTDVLNMCSDDTPVIRTRNDRIQLKLPALGSDASIGQRNDQYIMAIDGVNWKYADPGSTIWTYISTSMTPTYQANSFVELTRQTDKHTICAQSNSSGDQIYSWDGSTYLSLTSNAPRSIMFACNKYRVFGVTSDKRTVKHSALSSVTDWITSLDAGSITITNAKGNIKAITAFQGHILIWTANTFHELYGSSPDDFNLVDISNSIGCIGSRCFCECNNSLYWLHKSGLYQYTGGIPKKISQKVDNLFKTMDFEYSGAFAVMGAQGTKLYISFPSGAGQNFNNKLVVYDTDKQTWFVENDYWFSFTTIQGKLYGLKNGGTIWEMYSTSKTGYDITSTGNSTVINWNFITKGFKTEDPSKDGVVKSMWLEHLGTTSATIGVNVSTNIVSPTWSTIDSTFLNQTELTKTRLMLPYTQAKGSMINKFKVYGTGHKKIKGLYVKTLKRGDRDG
jgi:hypothetical protein